jgi:transcriptional regulator with XRE-family HTH domain
MELNFSPDKLIALRKLKGFSQEKLAEKAGINIRSLQRIEKQMVQPQPHTMGLLAEALGVSINDLCREAGAEATETISLRKLSLLHFSAASGFFIPLGNIILPYIIWIYKMENAAIAKKHVHVILNFQISWFIYMLILLAGYFTIEPLAFIVFLIPPVILFSLVICPFVSGIRITSNKSFFYPFSLFFFKSGL